MATSEPPGRTGDLRLSQHTVDRLRVGTEEAWRDFLVDYHSVFVKAVRVAAAKWRRPLPLLVNQWPAGIVDDAKTYFFTRFTKSFRTYLGEGQFRAFLYKVVHFFLRDHLDSIPREAPSASEHDESVSMAAWVADERRGSDDREQVLHGCIERLDAKYRSVVLLYCFGDAGQSLASVANMVGLSVEAAGKRFQRAKAFLEDCVRSQMENRRAV